MAYTGIPAALADWVKGQQLTPGMLALYLSIMYIILGCLIDGISMIVLTAVIVLPMVKQAGLDLVWFGVYLIIHVEMAQITPPVGFNLFVLQNMSGRDTLTVARAAFPFFVLLLVGRVHHHGISADRAVLAQARFPRLSVPVLKLTVRRSPMMSRLFRASLIAGAVLAATPALAQTKWNLPAAYPADNPHTENLVAFAKDVEAATSGKLQITVHPGASLFKAPDIKRAVQTGQAQMGEVLLSIHENEDPVYGVDVVPFLATSFPDAMKLYKASKAAIEKKLDGAGPEAAVRRCRGRRRASTSTSRLPPSTT